MRINHYHKCSNGHEWGHDLPPEDMSAAEYARRHDCPICGENVRLISRYENEAERERREEHESGQFLQLLLQMIRRP